MNKRPLLATAAASLLALGGLAALPAHADTLGQCYGVATAGHNDCAGLSGLHPCKGQSTTSYNPGDFVVKPTGTCARLGGLDQTEAKAVLASPAKTKAFEQGMARKMMHSM